MSTLEMRVAQLPKEKTRVGGFARVVSVLREVLDVLHEAKRQAYEAERRHPFTSC